jgi:1-phosphofructokinase family hexose kinase
MIVVGGFGSAFDRFIEVDELRPGAVLRARAAAARPGGKGAHVACTVAALGEPVRLVGIVDAEAEGAFRRFLEPRGVAFAGVRVAGPIRQCLAIRDRHGETTEILEPGPVLDEPVAEELRSRFESVAQESATLVLSGRLPRGVPAGLYGDLVRGSRGRALVDTSGEALPAALLARPFAIKPNREEAGALLGREIRDREDARGAVRELTRRGAACVILTLAREGAVAFWDDRLYDLRAPEVAERNSVGCGDCFVGGIAVGMERGLPREDVLRLGMACGAAGAMANEAGLLQREDVETLLGRVEVTTC